MQQLEDYAFQKELQKSLSLWPQKVHRLGEGYAFLGLLLRIVLDVVNDSDHRPRRNVSPVSRLNPPLKPFWQSSRIELETLF